MTKLKIIYESQFKRDYKIAKKRGLNIERMAEVIEMLADRIPLPPKCRDHKLENSRKYKKQSN